MARMTRNGLAFLAGAVALAGAAGLAQTPPRAIIAPAASAPCATWTNYWLQGANGGWDAPGMVEFYRLMPKTCIAERAEVLMRIWQTARDSGFVLEASASGALVIRPVETVAAATPTQVVAPPEVAEADLIARPSQRDWQNGPSAINRLRTEAVITLNGTLQPDGSFAWTLASESPAGSGLTGFAVRLAERHRARTVRPDGVSLVGGAFSRTFRFRPPA